MLIESGALRREVQPTTASDAIVSARVRRWFRTPRIEALLTLSAAFLFAPFFTRGHLILTNTDSLFVHFPNLLFGYRALKDGDLGLWNPYVFGGFDFSTSMHHHFLNPVHWWLLLFPEQYFFYGVTLEVFLEIVLIGILAYHIHLRLMRSRLVAAVLAIAVQLSGFVWFTTTTFIGTGLAVEALLALYLLITYRDRSTITNYVLLSFCFAGLFFWGHVAYVMAFGLPLLIAVAMLAATRRGQQPIQTFVAPVVLAGVTGLAVATVRLWPIVYGLLYEQLGQISSAWLSNGVGNTSYMMLTTFIPGLWGYELSSTSESMMSLGVTGRHGQFHNFLYFGVPVLALVVLALAGKAGRWAQIGGIVCIAVGTTQVIGAQLVTDIVQFLTWPAIHDMEYRVMCAAAAAFTVVAAWRYWSVRTASPPSIVPVLVVSALALTAAFTGYAKLVYQLRAAFQTSAGLTLTMQGLRIAVIGALAAAFWFGLRFRETPASVRRLTTWTLIGCWIGFAALALVATLQNLWDERLVVYGIVYGAAGTAWATLTLMLLRNAALTRQRTVVVSAYVALLALLLVPLPIGGLQGWGMRTLNPAADTLKFIALVGVTVEIIHQTLVARRRRLMFVLFWSILLLGDLLFFQKTFGFSGAPPFVAEDQLYPGYTQQVSMTQSAAPERRAPQLRDPMLEQIDHEDGWSGGGSARRFTTALFDGGTARIVTIENLSDDYATLFQDLGLGAGRQVTFGVWIRSSEPGGAGVDFGGPIFHSGSGQWEFVTASIRTIGDVIRPTLFVLGRGRAEFAAPTLADGFQAQPTLTPPGEVAAGHGAPATIDLTRYRVNRPWLFIGHPYGPVQASIESVYRVPTYGGADSDVKRRLVDFFAAFVPLEERWFTRAGIQPVIDHDRALDLMGVRYDFFETGGIEERPGAVARLSQFRRFEVIPDQATALKRLAAEDFDPARTLVVAADPGWPSDNAATSFSTPAFMTRGTGTIDVQLDGSGPSWLLFNDVFSDGWKATIDGAPTQVIAANGVFMAVATPAGARSVRLSFEPTAFWTAARVSLGLTGFLLALGTFAAGRAGYRRVRRVRR